MRTVGVLAEYLNRAHPEQKSTGVTAAALSSELGVKLYLNTVMKKIDHLF
jgi:hypothetical protein